MPIITYYHILGVRDTATRGEIAAAYRKKIKQWHPDICRHPDAEERMREVNEAAEVLLDIKLRKEYDTSLARELSLFEKARSWAREERQTAAGADEPVHDEPFVEYIRKRKAAAHNDPWISPGTIRFAVGFSAAAFIFLVLLVGIFTTITSMSLSQSISPLNPGTAKTAPSITSAGSQQAIEQGDELFESGDYEGALRMYDAIIARHPDIPNKEVWYNRGIALNFLGYYRDASESFDRVLSISPDDSLALAQKGASLLSLGRYEDALGYTDRALAGSSNAAWIWNNRAIALTNLGQQKEARAAFDNAQVLTSGRSGY